MDTNSVEYLEALLLRKLARKRKWGESHTAFDEWVKRALPPALQGAAKKVGEELITENLVLKKPTSYGLQVSLNQKRAEEIKQKIRKHFGEFIL